jgi:2',3'-cyclic-nucleotide 2'-phosphodiesterase (5'-nucleotidase family)
MKKNLRFLVFLTASLCCFWLVSCSPKVPDYTEIVILSINDVHGEFENLPQLAGFVKDMRATYENVIVVDAGDRFTGNPFNDFYEKSQFPFTDMLNHIGIDVMVLGNHEFDFGVPLLNERIKDSESVVITANIELKTSGLIGVKPYYIINKNGIKIAFLGLTSVEQQTGIPATLPKHVANIRFFDPIEIALNYRFLRNKSHIFVALTHIGTTEETVLANAMPELDLIIGGHSHTTLEEALIVNNVLITQAGSHAEFIGKTTITLEKGVITNINNELINLKTWDGQIDVKIVKKINYYKSNCLLNTPFATLKHEIPTHEQLGHMMTDAAIALTNADFSVINCGGIRINYLPAGPVTYGDMFRVSPFGNHLMVVDLTPAEIRYLIEMEFTEKRTCLMIPGGFEYIVKRIPGNNIEVIKMYPNGQLLDENKTYRVVLNNYLFSTYLPNHMGYVDVTVVDNMVEFLRNNPNVDYRNTPSRARYN